MPSTDTNTASDDVTSGAGSASEVSLLVKNPTDAPGATPFSLTVPSTCTVRDVKSLLNSHYPGNPALNSQRLIHAGKLLSDADKLSAVLQNSIPPHIIHLVVSSRSANASSSASRVHRPSAVPDPAPTPSQQQQQQQQQQDDGTAAAYAEHMRETQRAFEAVLSAQRAYLDLVNMPPPRNVPAANSAAAADAYARYDDSVRRQRAAIHANMFPHVAPQYFLRTHNNNDNNNAAAAAADQQPQQQPQPQQQQAQQNANVIGGAAIADPARQGAGQPQVRQFVFQFDLNLNWTLLAKLALLVFILGQEGSPKRFKILGLLAAFVYLWQTGHLRFLRRVVGIVLPHPAILLDMIVPNARAVANAQRNLERNENSNVEADGEENAAQQQSQEQQLEPLSFATKLAVLMSYSYTFFYGFFCSLLPSWRTDPLPNLFDVLNRGQNGPAPPPEGPHTEPEHIEHLHAD